MYFQLIDPCEFDEATPNPDWVVYSIVPGTRDVTANETFLINCGLISCNQHHGGGTRIVEQLL